jgi:rod shape-determining protein MreC
MQSHKRAPQRRLPLREILFLAALIGAAAAVSWASGRTMVLNEIFAPVLGGVEHVTGAWNRTVDRVKALQTLEEDNQRLKLRLDELETLVIARDEQVAENARLHDLLHMPLPKGVEPLVARVVGRNPDNWHQRLMLDAGTERGVKVDGVVVTRRGLVGRVVAVSANTANVALATDPGSSVSVINTRTRSAGVMQGQGDAWPALRYMEQPEKWKMGDRLVTSGFGGTIPRGLNVGKIVRLKNEKGTPGAPVQAMLFPELRVAVAVDLDKLEEVMVLPPGLAAVPTPPPPPPRPKPSPKPSPKSSPKPTATGHAATGPGASPPPRP